MLHSICQQIWKTQQWPQDWKRSVFIPIPKKSNAKECSNYCTVALISHASKVMLKILEASFNSMWTMKFQMFKLDLGKAEEAEIKLPTSVGSSKKQESSRKTSTSALLTVPKAFDCVDHSKLWKIPQETGIPDHLTCPPDKSVCRSRNNSLNHTWNNRLVPNCKRSTSRLCIVTLLI